MEDIKLGSVEGKFADIIWSNEPIPSGELVKLCAKELEWKKSTTYTVLKKLCDKGIFMNEGGTVVSRISKEELSSMQSEKFVEDNFDGSLPAFIAAFSKRGHISARDAEEIKRLIDSIGKDNI